MEEKIHNLQKENKLLKLQLLHLSEDIELMYERMEKLEAQREAGKEPLHENRVTRKVVFIANIM